MKRRLAFLAVPAALAAAAALPAIVFAAHHETYEGPLAGGANNAVVEFFARFEHGKAQNVHRFHWVNDLCNGGGATTGRIHLRMRVNDQGAFRGHGPASGQANGTAHITGQFTHHDRRAHGTFRFEGPGCDTGLDDWHAKQGPL